MKSQKCKEILEGSGRSLLDPRKFLAPGRINLIGEHVDYVGGKVLPAAIGCYLEVEILPHSENVWEFYSVNSSFGFQLPCENLKNPRKEFPEWTLYPLGVIAEFQKKGYSIPGMRFQVYGNIPQGAGLSSSAAYEMAIGFGINEILGFGLDRIELALVGQAAEKNFAGTNCGIMDQFAIAMGKKNHCISLDTNTLDFQYIAFDLEHFEFSLINSNVKHKLNDGQYNLRRQECEEAVFVFRKKYPDLLNLYSASSQETDWPDLPLQIKRRVRHVTSERERTLAFASALASKNFTNAGKLLTQTHWSLSQEFEVSCPETDYLVEKSLELGVSGARMMGGGFGGCVLVLASKGVAKEVFNRIAPDYFNQFRTECSFLPIEIVDGVKENNPS